MNQIELLPTDGEVIERPVNVATVPHLSPFRYAGGKTWFIPLFRRWMRSFGGVVPLLVEPFVGGGIVSLTAVIEKRVERAEMVEMDSNVAAVWRVLLGEQGNDLARRIRLFEMTIENVRAEFERDPEDDFARAFQTIIKNRTAHGGILAEGAGVLKHGENGKGVLSRWYPETLAKRILAISAVKDRIRFHEGDAFDVIQSHLDDTQTAFFIDPPYSAGGKRAGARLYTHWQINHERLFELCSEVNGQFLMTYDNASEVRELARRFGFQFRPVPMKNTHHAEMTELVIGKNLDWMDDSSLIYDAPVSEGEPKLVKRRSVRYEIPKKTKSRSPKTKRTPTPEEIALVEGSAK